MFFKHIRACVNTATNPTSPPPPTTTTTTTNNNKGLASFFLFTMSHKRLKKFMR